MNDPSDGRLSYRDAGVDIDAGDAVVSGVRDLARGTHNERVLRGLGHFGGFYRIGPASAGATLVASIDGVGTKLKVASLAGRHEHIGADIVNHCVNDIIACGAEPLFFLDYYGTGRLEPDAALTVLRGITAACRESGVALIGGETAEMPGLYAEGDYDLVGSIVGIVQEGRIIDGREVQAGDVLIGLPSSGFHTNGYSLIRVALRLNESDAARRRLNEPAPFDASQTLADVLLRPHRSYRREVAQLLDAGVVHGMAHITGGGLPGNVSRIVPEGMVAEIDVDAWETPDLFEYVAEAGHIARGECYRAFNMGIGYVVVSPAEAVERVHALIPESVVIGRMSQGAGEQRVVLLGVEEDLG